MGKLWNRDIEFSPTTYYHYTDLKALNNIICNIHENEIGEPCVYMRATEATCMNDPTETIYFKNLLKDCIEEYCSTKKITDSLAKTISKSILAPSEQYIISFSSLSDALVMWRGYGHDGYGVAIGFDIPDYFHPTKCIYAEKYDIKEVLDKLIQNNNEEKDLDSSLEFFNNQCKHPAYKEEKEYGVMIPYNDYSGNNDYEVHFNTKNGIIYPYINISFPTSCIKEIIVGPCAESILTKKNIEKLLKEKKVYHNCQIECSSIPYLVRNN